MTLIGPYLLHQQLSAQIYWVFWRKSYENAGRNLVGSREKHSSSMMGLWATVPVRSELLTAALQQSLDWMGQACGLVSQVTECHTNGILPMGPH